MNRVVMFFLATISISVFAGDASEILQNMKDAQDYKTSRAAYAMIIENKGKTTTMEFEGYHKKGEKDLQLMRFTSPPRIEDTAILIKGEKIWYYNKRSNRVRLLSKSAKKGSMMGSTFSYNDLNIDYVEDFTGEILEDEKDHYILKIYPVDRERNYRYIVARVNKENFIEERLEYYDKNEVRYKVMVTENVKQVKDRWTAIRVIMTDLISGKITRIETHEKSLDFDFEMEDSEFSEKNLKK
ncbi:MULTISPECIES: outer membrane lipoprotein-sorting protein [Psychrilyobacter]|uniref:Outer membrane lipoprotein-sorting protein n=1 Tax=Psychrilyobacter piezotolerans TaxID=2293438 RepID=A0ABX9KH89_9FUSO|nr:MULTISPECIES: outer membrane lipoprotein-sorting protein [Psychrilyobacter]MCS5420677.1 outer membrane lipoprotein-sorting protein [Psychrilyobacter sp. S5]NDI77851.1 outer membrane lipoprotein-sorting protein [Psychrilyobacter piezotolerans]RDE62295.1 outer membrane lipoprotein-sorting protein [Psychrilyobacter sp. S5]REI41393.1 outer membrane lipoprotein-sorting protein [Psychrilyobacter piezotolerans]